MTSEKKDDSIGDNDRDEMKLLYQVSVSDITFFKQQQWTATTHVMAIYAAILLIASQLLSAPLCSWQQWLLVTLTWSAAVGGLAVGARLQNSISGRRARLERVREYFGKEFRDAWSIPKPRDENHYLLYCIMLVGAVVVTWLVLVEF